MPKILLVQFFPGHGVYTTMSRNLNPKQIRFHKIIKTAKAANQKAKQPSANTKHTNALKNRTSVAQIIQAGVETYFYKYTNTMLIFCACPRL